RRHNGLRHHDSRIVKVHVMPGVAWQPLSDRGQVGASALAAEDGRTLPPYVQAGFAVVVISGNGRAAAPYVIHFDVPYLLRMTGHTSFPYVYAKSPLSRL